ncbi:MAG: dihydropteroate synthase [Nitrospirota bacterium]
MLVIGERISIVAKSMREAMMKRDPKPIQERAKLQVECGADMLDVSIGPADEGGEELMEWVVKVVQDVTSVPLCLDTTNPTAMEVGLKAHDNTWGRPMINSTDATEERMNAMLPLAARYDADIIALTLAGSGIPKTAEEKCEIASEIISKAFEYDLSLERIYLDPLILTVSGMQDSAEESIRAIRLFQEINDPPMKTSVGLSNISNGCPKGVREVINRNFLSLLIYEGLTAAIVDPTDKELMDTMKTTEMLLGKRLYAHSYLDM